ncbi:MAG: hypothetical protein V2G33_01505 [bacterium JZ-2024 1]
MRRRAGNYYKKPEELPFLEEEIERTTVLFGGFTARHDYLIEAAMRGLGYRAKALPQPDNRSLEIGKEFCDRGLCNPTYYTVGNLLKYLFFLRSQGETDIEKKYVFVTIGSCGPCRFGMYEAEYRKALKDAGFPNFRVIVLNEPGVGQISPAVKISFRFLLSFLKALILADILNETGYRLRPYEIKKGSVDEILRQGTEQVYSALCGRKSVFPALFQIRKQLKKNAYDFARKKPKVKVIGEFWAQTTEGEGNYCLFRWLEEEGCEVDVEPISMWVMYILFGVKSQLWDRYGLKKQGWERYVDYKTLLAVCVILLIERIYRFFYWLFSCACGGYAKPLTSVAKLAKLAKDHYNIRLRGGEGFLEVGKHIFSFLYHHAHLVISVKPFGCMPSTQSDGVQARVVGLLPDSLFIPVETSGDGEVHFRSRIQMKLHEARRKILG